MRCSGGPSVRTPCLAWVTPDPRTSERPPQQRVPAVTHALRPTYAAHRRGSRGRARLALAALATAVALTGCGDDGGAGGAGPTAVETAADGSVFNQADVDFASQMIPHHAQAVQMVVMAQGRDVDSEVAAVMEEIRASQVPEIETMTDWLTSWDQPVPETSLDHANAGHDGTGMHDMEGMDGMDMDDMPGMMSGEQMSSLEDADGSAFQEMWLSMMVAHHEGAVEMAQTEVEDGENPDAVALARSIAQSQAAEIETLEALQG